MHIKQDKAAGISVTIVECSQETRRNDGNACLASGEVKYLAELLKDLASMCVCVCVCGRKCSRANLVKVESKSWSLQLNFMACGCRVACCNFIRAICFTTACHMLHKSAGEQTKRTKKQQYKK